MIKNNDISKKLFITLAAVLTVARLFLAWTQYATIYPPLAPIDDHFMFTTAQNIVAGEWFGEYNYLTLSKHAFFAVWLAFLHIVGIPYMVGSALLWTAASIVLVLAVSPFIKKNRARLFLYAGLLYNPAVWAQFSTRIYRDNIFPSLCMLFFGCVLAVGLRYRGWVAIPCAGAVLCWISWQRGPLEYSAEALLRQISTLYDLGYGWGVVHWTEQTTVSSDDTTLALCVLGCLIVLAVSWTVIRGKSPWLGALAAFLPLAPCMVLTDTVPASGFLYMQFLTIGLLLLTQSVRRRDARQGNRLTALAAVPVALALGGLFFLMPREDYQSYAGAEFLEAWVQALFDRNEKPQGTDGPTEPGRYPAVVQDVTVDLDAAAPRIPSSVPVMDVLAEQTGPMYLRGGAYNTHRKATWVISAGATGTDVAFFRQGDLQSVVIQTVQTHSVLYAPYGATALRYSNSHVLNQYGRREYTVSYYSGWPQYSAEWEKPEPYMPDIYIQLDPDTQVWAREYLAENLPELAAMEGVWEKANAIIRHVKGSARYDLQTPRMPEDRDDFAQWFLEESETGYCVHFASAAVVLLRAEGIPARYVTGYLASTQAGETVTVVEENAHAWVECYVNGVGWILMEPTPGDGIPNIVYPDSTDPTVDTTEPSEETTVPTTEAPTEPSGTQTQPTTVPPTTEAPTASTPPENTNVSQNGGAEPPAAQENRIPPWIGAALLRLLWIAGAVAVVLGQWKLRVRIRKAFSRRGNTNAQALARWRQVERHARVRKETPDETLYALAQRAKFSQYRITREELHSFDIWLTASENRMRQEPFLRRMLYTLVLALYD